MIISSRSFFLFLFCLLSHFVYSQNEKRIVHLLDIETKLPIANVHVYDSISQKGVVSNAEGKIKIPTSLNISDLTISHIGYESDGFMEEKNKIYLIPKISQLEEILIVENFNLKKKIRYVIKNYEDLYDASPKTFYFNYKEAKRKNDTLYKLFQAQLKWDNTRGKMNRKDTKKENKFELIGVEFSKLTLPKWDYISMPDFIVVVHLQVGFILGELSFLKNISIQQIRNIDNGKVEEVIFDADMVKPYLLFFGRSPKESKLENSKIYFDKETGAILKVLLNKKINRSNLYMITETEYKKQKNKKMILSHLFMENVYNFKKTNIIKVMCDFSVTEIKEKEKSSSTRNMIPFSNLRKIKTKSDYPNQDKITLTKEEKEFLKGKVEQ